MWRCSSPRARVTAVAWPVGARTGSHGLRRGGRSSVPHLSPAAMQPTIVDFASAWVGVSVTRSLDITSSAGSSALAVRGGDAVAAVELPS